MAFSANRRDFLKNTAALAGGTWLCATSNDNVLGAEAFRPDPPPRASYPIPKIRPNIMDLDPNGPEVLAYKAGVAEMKRLAMADADNPTGWVKQAEIHLNFCPHGNWFFLTWHRAYLHFFERICRKASGNSDFMLPYWDWTAQPALPDVFWGDPATNSLFNNRDIVQGQDIPAEFVGPSVIQSIFDDSNFITAIGSDPAPSPRGGGGAQSTLESTPHNNVHVEIGGDMITFMSPLDPIFWLHHANVDRIWALWDDRYPGQFPADPNFRAFEYKEFVDENGQAMTMTVAQTMRTHDLGYAYPGQKPPAAPALLAAAAAGAAPPPETANAEVKKVVPSNNEVLQVAVTRKDSVNKRLGALAMASSSASGAAPQFATKVSGATLKIEEIQGDISHDYYLRVFLNCDYLTPRTPISDPHFVASVAFFGSHNHGDHNKPHPMPRSFYLNLSPTLARLGKRFRPDQDLKVGLVLVPRALAKSGNAPPPKLTPTTISIQTR